MKPFAVFLSIIAVFINSSNFKNNDAIIQKDTDNSPRFSLSKCTSSAKGNVTTYDLWDSNSKVGHAIWISRESREVNAKYFAYKTASNSVYDRYKIWRPSKNVVIMSSGAYASRNAPIGVTVDNGVIVNRGYDDKMDGLVIVYATGGIVVSNVEDGDLYLRALDKKIDVRNNYHRTEFLNWAKSERAAVFQTHLLAYKNRLRFYKDNGESARRKFLVLATSSSGELFHMIYYTKGENYTLFEAANGALRHLNSKGMDVTAIVNLDTGMFDILGTGEDTRDCNDNLISGTTKDRSDMNSLLVYEYE